MALVAGQVPTSGYRTPDYSGAAAAGGAAAAAPYEMIQGLIGQYEQNKKQTAEINVAKKTAASRIDSMLNLYGDKIPGLKDQLESYKSTLNDPKMSQYEQGITASSLVQELDNLLNMNMQASQYGLQQLKMQQMQQSMQQSAAGSAGGGIDLFSDG
jgi:predicted transcriptional regulator